VKKYVVELTEDEREQLHKLISAGSASARMRREARAWCEARNRQQASVDWRFTTAEARTKLRRLYPSIDR
jgi:hypothetical protein